MAAGTAREHVRVARALPGLPLLHAAFAAGELSYSKVREATRLAGRIDEGALLRLARSCTASQLERAVRGFRRADGDRLQQELARRVRWRTTEDGSFVLTATLPPEEGAVLLAALETATGALAEQLTSAASAQSSGDAKWSTPEGRAARAGTPIDPVGGCGTDRPPVDAADALLAVANGYLNAEPADTTGQDRHLVVVHIDPEVLAAGAGAGAGSEADESVKGVPAGTPEPVDASDVAPMGVPAGGACEVAGVGGVTASTAARLACDATVLAVIRNSSGAVLNLGRRRRLVSPAQRRALSIRDGCCQHPGCTRTHALQAHHVVHWSRGGRTDLNNLVLLCRFHHLAVHEGIIAIDPSRRVTQPDGRPLPDETALRRGLHRSVAEHEWIQIRNRLDDITTTTWRWNDEHAQTIRPLWRGERFDLGHIVATMFTNLAA